jgi:hemerythrin-like domain-containing protein
MKAVDIIREEHRSMASVLKSLLNQAQAARAGTADADWPLYAAMLDYLQAFPEVTHHPKEDQFLFPALRRRYANADSLLATLEDEHKAGAELLRRLVRQLEVSKTAQRVGDFADALEGYAQFQWRHMEREEKEVLPLAMEKLLTADWAAIDTAFAANREPRW